MSSIMVAKGDGVAPATEQFAIDQNPDVSDKVGPFWVSVQAWTHTADVAAGGYVARLVYDDPTGQSRTVESGIVSLSDASAINQSGVVAIERLSDVSDFRFETELFGSAGSALVSYRLMITQADLCSLQTLGLTPIP